MNYGFIPLLTEQCGVDIDNNNGFMIDVISLEAILEAIKNTERYTDNELLKMSKNAQTTIQDCYSITSYQKRLNEIITDIINNNI